MHHLHHLPCAAWVLLALWAPLGPAQTPDEAATGPGVLIALRPTAAVTSLHVTLGDVAVIQGGELSLRQQLARLDLTDLPQANPRAHVSREQVAFRIRLAGTDPQGFRVEGAPEVEVNLARCEVSEDELLAAARGVVLQRMPWPAEALVIQLAEPIHSLDTLDAAKEDVRLDADLRMTGLPLGKVRVDVAVRVKGQRRENVPVYLDVKLSQQVLVAAARIERGDVVREDEVRFEQRTVDRLNNYLTSGTNVVGNRAKFVLVPGQVITSADVEPVVPDNPVLIRQHSLVRIVARVGSLQVSTAGEALQDGRAGQLIRVRNVDSNHIVLGRVVDRSVVEVDF